MQVHPPARPNDIGSSRRGPRKWLLLAAIVAAFCIVLAWIAAHGSGWSELASHFPYRGPTPSTVVEVDYIVLYRPGGGPFMLGNDPPPWPRPFGSGVRAAVTNEGLYLAQTGPLRLFASPVLIPWAAISSYSLTTWQNTSISGKWLSGSRYDTNLLTTPGIRVSLPDSQGNVLAECERRSIPRVKGP